MMAIATTKAPAHPLPGTLRRGLGRIGRRLRAVALVRGAGTLALALALGAIAGMAADFACVLPQPVRWALWGLWVATAVVILVRSILRPLAGRTRWVDLAALAERAQPRLGERLTGAVALLEARGRAHGSRELIGALADEAGERSHELDPVLAVPARGAGRRLTLGLACAAVVVAPALVRPDPFAALLARFVAPWADVERVGRYVLSVRPGDATVALGDDVTIAAEVRPRLGTTPSGDDLALEWTGPDGRYRRVPMAADSAVGPTGARTWKLTLPRVERSFRYRVVASSTRTAPHRITAVEPPAVASLEARVEPPAYTGQKPFPARDPARLEAWEGSLVRLTFRSNKPLRKAVLHWPKEGPSGAKSTAARQPLAAASADGRTWTIAAPAEASGVYELALEDEHRFKNRPEPARRLIVRPDRPPTVALVGADAIPGESSPDDALTLEVAARDDVAVAVAELHYAIVRGNSAADPESGHVPLKLPGLGTRAARGETALDLKRLALRPGDGLSYRVRVADNRPAPKGPNVAWTPIRGLAIVAQADPMLARRAAAERARLQETLTALKKSAAENRQAAEQLRYAADAVQRGNGRWDEGRQAELAAREAAAREVVDRLHLFAKQLADSRQFAPLARPARQVADVEAEGGREMLAQARRSNEASARLDDLKQADGRLQGVQNRLEELQRKFDEIGRREDDRGRLQALAERQESLAARAAELAAGPADRARLDQAQAEQAKLNRELDEIVKRSPELKADLLDAQARAAADLAEKARELARKQRDEARRTGDPARLDATLRALADAQRALEDDARRLAMKVDTPLAENGRGRLNADALARAVDPLTRGDVEGAVPRLDEAENELRRLASDLDDVRDDPKALARRLVRRQDELRDQAGAAVRETVENRGKPTPEEQQALAGKLGPLAAREAAILDMVKALPVPKDQRSAARTAAERLDRALKNLREPKPDEIDRRQNEARDALNRLAEVLPEPYQAREAARRTIEEARGRTENVAREVERHLRETAPQPGRPHDPERAAADLAERLAPLAKQEAEAAADLAAAAVEPRLEPQRARAARRTQALADALAQARRDALPAIAADARAAADRLSQKSQGRIPADDRAAELADELRGLRAESAKQPDQAPAAQEAHRIAAALRALDVPDAPMARDHAARLAEAAAEAKKGDPAPALATAAEAADALARRLADRTSPREEVQALARAERAVDAPRDPAAAARTQRAIAAELARVAPPDDRAAAEAVDRAAALADQAADPYPRDGQERPTPEALAAARDRAAEGLEALAGKMDGGKERPAQGVPSPPNPRARAEELAREQRDIAGQIQEVADQARSNPDANAARAGMAERLAPLLEKQARLAEAARALTDPRPDAEPRRESARRRAAAGVAQGRAAEAMSRRDAGQAANLAREAASDLERLASQLPAGAPAADPAPSRMPDDPALGLDPARAREAGDLARRQRQIRERLQAVLAERAEPQAALRAEAAALGRDLAALRDQSREVSPRAQGPAHLAADLLGRQAPEAMEQGIEGLNRGRLDAARGAQRRAAEAVQHAAEQAEDLAAALRADRPAEAPPDSGGEVARARDAQHQAASELAQARDPGRAGASSRAASQAMRQAAEGLRSVAQAGRGRPEPGPGDEQTAENGADRPSRGDPNSTMKDPKGAPAGTADADLAELKDLVRTKTGRAWGELPGHLRTEILQMSQGRYRDDYARLIQLYFREIAAGREASSP